MIHTSLNPLLTATPSWLTGEPLRFARPMQSSDIIEQFPQLVGLSKVPADFEGETLINGHRVWMVKSGARGARKHRAMTTCPDCGKVLTCGNLNQHMYMMKRKEMNQ
jgi:hypothetical protein